MCFSLEFIKELAIWAVILIAVVALIRLVISPLAATLGTWGGVLIQALNIVLWAIVAIIVIAIVFDLIACLLIAAPRLHP